MYVLMQTADAMMIQYFDTGGCNGDSEDGTDCLTTASKITIAHDTAFSQQDTIDARLSVFETSVSELNFFVCSNEAIDSV